MRPLYGGALGVGSGPGRRDDPLTTRYIIDPEQSDHPLAREHADLVRRESALGDELAAWTGRAGVRFAGSFVTGVPRAFRTAVLQSRVIRERNRLERRLIRLGVMIPAGQDRAPDAPRAP